MERDTFADARCTLGAAMSFRKVLRSTGPYPPHNALRSHLFVVAPMTNDDSSDILIDPAESAPIARTVLEATDTVVLVLGEEGRIHYLNPACEQLTGYTTEELRGEVVFDVLVPESEREDVRAYWKKIWAGEGGPRHRNPWVTKEGDRLYMTWSNALIRAEDGRQYVVATGTDVTRQRKLEYDIVSVSESERQRIGQELHDTLASDLVAAAMKMDNLRERLGSREMPKKEVLGRLESIEGSVREASKQARSLSHLLVAGDVGPAELPSALSELVETYREAVGTECTLSLPEENVSALIDEAAAGHLYRIAQEAVRNAVQHGDPEHVNIEIEVAKPASPNGGAPNAERTGSGADARRLVVRIRDDGTGLPEEISTKLNDAGDKSTESRIGQGRETDQEPNRGRKQEKPGEGRSDGIGLHLMSYRADLIGADLSVQSAEGEGTVVRCELPIG